MNNYFFLDEEKTKLFVLGNQSSLMPPFSMNLISRPQANLQTVALRNPLESLFSNYEPFLLSQVQFLSPSQQDSSSSIVQEEQVNESLMRSKTSHLNPFEQKKNDSGTISNETTFSSFKVEEKEGVILGDTRSNAMQVQVDEMLDFFLKNYGKIGEKELFFKGIQYIKNPYLFNLFKALIEKFETASKSKEDLTRFVVRKAISSLRNSLRNKHNISAKAASIALCKKYFSTKLEESSNMNDDDLTMDDEELLNFRLPYKKNSRHRTANTMFIIEIFASQVFYQDYLEFLDNFRELLYEENQKRVQKFSDFLVSCVQRNEAHAVKDFKRLPWLDTWIEATEKIARDLLNAKNWKETHKKFKIRSR